MAVSPVAWHWVWPRAMLWLAMCECLVVGGSSSPSPVKVYQTEPRSGKWLHQLEDLQWQGIQPVRQRRAQPAVTKNGWENFLQPFRKLQPLRRLQAALTEVELPTVRIDLNSRFQSILGFGGAFTATSSVNWKGLSETDREEVLRLYFGSPAEGGHGYAIGRVHINSCDFSPEIYSLDDTNGDVELKYFDTSLSHDRSLMLPFIQAAKRRAEASGVQEFRMIASPWSPPAWMKQPHKQPQTDGESKSGVDDLHANLMLGSASPLGLIPAYNRTWAEYISRFISAYTAHGVQIWAVTAQNEPEASSPWESCTFSAHDESLWIRQHLGPVLRRDHPTVNILAFDHNKDHLVNWAREMYEGDGGASRDFVDGLAMHWYAGSYFEHVKEAAVIGGPNKWLIGSEACNCPGISRREDEQLDRAEKLAHDLLGDLKAGAHSWLDWNLLLDPYGGPSHAFPEVDGGMKKPSCDANIVADPSRILGKTPVTIQPSYYYIGHFSRFARPGARVIGSGINGWSLSGKKVDVITFLSPDAQSAVGEEVLVLVMLNREEQPVEFVLYDVYSGKESMPYSVPARSVTTFTYPKPAGPLWTWVETFNAMLMVLGVLGTVTFCGCRRRMGGLPFLQSYSSVSSATPRCDEVVCCDELSELRETSGRCESRRIIARLPDTLFTGGEHDEEEVSELFASFEKTVFENSDRVGLSRESI